MTTRARSQRRTLVALVEIFSSLISDLIEDLAILVFHSLFYTVYEHVLDLISCGKSATYGERVGYTYDVNGLTVIMVFGRNAPWTTDPGTIDQSIYLQSSEHPLSTACTSLVTHPTLVLRNFSDDRLTTSFRLHISLDPALQLLSQSMSWACRHKSAHTCISPPICLAASSSVSCLLPTMYTFAPLTANPSAMALPSPEPPPVTTTTLPLTEKSSSSLNDTCCSAISLE
jgi:hypothetical protein